VPVEGRGRQACAMRSPTSAAKPSAAAPPHRRVPGVRRGVRRLRATRGGLPERRPGGLR